MVGEGLSADTCPFVPKIINSRWFSRGWVHQEISFSQRLLIFGTNMLYMRCGDLQACENGWHNSHRGYDWQYLDEMNPHDLRIRPFEAFAQHVETYYMKQLTVETDRLPAMAALASQVAKSTESQYLAGLWRDNLANDLLFCVEPNRGVMPIEERIRELAVPKSNARPSWSWAGHSDRFKGVGDDSGSASLSSGHSWKLDCVVVDADARPVGANPFGAVMHAHLTLRCRMVVLKELLGVGAQTSSAMTFGFTPDEIGLRLLWDTNNDAAPGSLAATVSLICTSERRPSQHFQAQPPCKTAGLIVYPTGRDGEYYRVGMWKGHTGSFAKNNREWKSQTVILV